MISLTFLNWSNKENKKQCQIKGSNYPLSSFTHYLVKPEEPHVRGVQKSWLESSLHLVQGVTKNAYPL